jgi:hypothetical protein
VAFEPALYKPPSVQTNRATDCVSKATPRHCFVGETCKSAGARSGRLQGVEAICLLIDELAPRAARIGDLIGFVADRLGHTRATPSTPARSSAN